MISATLSKTSSKQSMNVFFRWKWNASWGKKMEVSSKGSYSRSAAVNNGDILQCQMLSLITFLSVLCSNFRGPQGPLRQMFNASLRVWLHTVRNFFALSEALAGCYLPSLVLSTGWFHSLREKVHWKDEPVYHLDLPQFLFVPSVLKFNGLDLNMKE